MTPMDRVLRASFSLVHVSERGSVSRFQHEVHPGSHIELLEQSRDVKLHGPFGNVQLRRDFLVGEILRDAAEHLALAQAQRNLRFRNGAALDELDGATHKGFHEILTDGDQHSKVPGHLLTYHALNGQQTDGLVPSGS